MGIFPVAYILILARKKPTRSQKNHKKVKNKKYTR